MSVYLEAPEAMYTPPQMAPRAKFTLSLFPWDANPKDISKGRKWSGGRREEG